MSSTTDRRSTREVGMRLRRRNHTPAVDRGQDDGTAASRR
jgi:hypothetical protein